MVGKMLNCNTIGEEWENAFCENCIKLVGVKPFAFGSHDIWQLKPQHCSYVSGVKITYNKDGSLKFPKNATADIKTLATGMAKTKAGLKELHAMDNSKTKISMTKDRDKVEREKDGTMRAGGTEPIISQKTVDGKPVGDKYISSAKITIYEAGINEMFKQGGGRMSINGTNVDNKTFSTDDIMASFAVHEGTHVTNKGSSSSLNPKASKADIESKPYQNQLLHLNQLEENRQ